MSFKPSTLFSSPQRASPFRRPESPASPSPLRNSAAPVSSQSAIIAARSATLPAKSLFESPVQTQTIAISDRPANRLGSPIREPEKSPTKTAKPTSDLPSASLRHVRGGMMGTSNTDAMSKLQPGQIRELREGFQILDRDGDGLVTREDLVEMLTQLGLPASTSDVAPFFLDAQSQSITLPAFLTQISTLQSILSPPAELLSAFSAFDDDDSGQVDLKELRDALVHTVPDTGDSALSEREVDRILNGFAGRRTFGKESGFGNQKRGEVFKYNAFVGAISGTNSEDKENKE